MKKPLNWITPDLHHRFINNKWLRAALDEQRWGLHALDALEVLAIGRLTTALWGDRERAIAFVLARSEYARRWARDNAAAMSVAEGHAEHRRNIEHERWLDEQEAEEYGL